MWFLLCFRLKRSLSAAGEDLNGCHVCYSLVCRSWDLCDVVESLVNKIIAFSWNVVFFGYMNHCIHTNANAQVYAHTINPVYAHTHKHPMYIDTNTQAYAHTERTSVHTPKWTDPLTNRVLHCLDLGPSSASLMHKSDLALVFLNVNCQWVNVIRHCTMCTRIF